MSTREIHRRAWLLMRRNALPLLLASLLAALVLLLSMSVEAFGEQQAVESVAHLHPGPQPERESEAFSDWFFDAWTYKYELDDALHLWQGITAAVSLALGMLLPLVTVGLQRVLLAASRGEAVRTAEVFSGFTRGAGRTLGLSLQVTLRRVGWMLLIGFTAYMVAAPFPEVAADIIGAVLSLPLLAVALSFYVLCFLHLADERSDALTVKDCLRQGSFDQVDFGILRLLRALWPMLPGLVLMALAAALLPAWAEPVPVLLFHGAAYAFRQAVFSVVYLPICEERLARMDTEGAQRARALSES